MLLNHSSSNILSFLISDFALAKGMIIVIAILLGLRECIDIASVAQGKEWNTIE